MSITKIPMFRSFDTVSSRLTCFAYISAALLLAGCGDEHKKEDIVPVGNEAFTLEIAETSSSWAKISILPADESATYFYDCLTEEEYQGYGGDEGIIDSQADLIERAVEIFHLGGYPDKKFSDFLYTGKTVKTIKELKPSCIYILFAFGMDTEGNGTTGVYKTTFRTSGREDAFSIEIGVSDISFNSATVRFTPTDKTETYFTDCMDYETFSSLGEDGVIDYVIKNTGNSLKDYLTSGDHLLDASRMLDENTKYIAYAFGYTEKGVTTGIFSTEFSTPPMKVGSSASVTAGYRIVDGGTVNAEYAGQRAALVSMTPSHDTWHWYCGTFESLASYSDREVTKILASKGLQDQKEIAVLLPEGSKTVFAAVSVDKDGTFGDVRRITLR